MDPKPSPFTSWLSARLALAGIDSGAELHRRLGGDAPAPIGQAAVRAWMRGENRPSPQHMGLLLDALAVPAAQHAEAWRLLSMSGRAA